MTQVFSEDGSMLGVTAIEAGPCPVLSVREKAVQVGFDVAKDNALKKPQADFFKKIKIAPRRFIREFVKDSGAEFKVGDELKADLFKVGDFVDVTGISKGKGFQGGMKRWHWAGGPGTHGHTTHRKVGSIGSTTTPGRVFKGHSMPGHMGYDKVTVQSLKVVRVDVNNNLLLVEGAVPGHKNSYLIIKKAIKKTKIK